MKQLNLNIVLDEKVYRQVENGVDKEGKPIMKEEEVPAVEVATNWLAIMVERAINKPKLDQRTNRLVPTVEVSMPVHIQYGKVISALEGNKEGIVEMDDELFSFLDRKFHQAELSLNRDVTKILIKLEKVIEEARKTS